MVWWGSEETSSRVTKDQEKQLARKQKLADEQKRVFESQRPQTPVHLVPTAATKDEFLTFSPNTAKIFAEVSPAQGKGFVISWEGKAFGPTPQDMTIVDGRDSVWSGNLSKLLNYIENVRKFYKKNIVHIGWNREKVLKLNDWNQQSESDSVYHEIMDSINRPRQQSPGAVD